MSLFRGIILPTLVAIAVVIGSWIAGHQIGQKNADEAPPQHCRLVLI